MNGTSTKTNALERLSNALRGIHRQIAALQQREALMARALSAISRKTGMANPREEALTSIANSIGDDVPQAITATQASPPCPACGGPLDRHPAACGDLLICTACGFSEFVDDSGLVRSASLPPPPPIPSSLSQPPSWVD